MLLCRHSVGTYLETSSHATRQGMLSHSHLISLSHCGLILAIEVELVFTADFQFKKKKKKSRRGMNSETFSQNSSHMRKKPP